LEQQYLLFVAQEEEYRDLQLLHQLLLLLPAMVMRESQKEK
jgi:hypothetical protein